MAGTSILLDPPIPLPLLWAAAGLAALFAVIAFRRGLAGWWLRALTALALLVALANPAIQTQERRPLSDIVVLMIDESASQRLDGRTGQTARAVAHLRRQIEALPLTELRTVRVEDSPDNGGTRLMTALRETLAELPRERMAGAFLVTDGRVHDTGATPDMPAPLHALLTGRQEDWDRRLLVENAPAFAILDEPVTLRLRVVEQGPVPADRAGRGRLAFSLNGETPREVEVPVGRAIELPVTLEQAGRNVLQVSLDTAEGELTERNNTAVIEINGVRDRLSVLLVSGEPHAGQRTWRNLLKSDSAVDLVHFTILRPPGKDDDAPVSELSLIAFPTQELFIERIEDFDLIILDRYRRRGILPMSYFGSIRDYVEGGGAVLVAAGPELAGVDSIHRTTLGEIFPGRPTARVFEQGFLPRITDLGRRHPVTRGLEDFGPRIAPDPAATTAPQDGPGWGRWFRQIEIEEDGGQTIMSGVGDAPLLMLDRVEDGRLALLASDHAWLWSRGFEGGGPQLELLRRLAHWMMGEPDLEEEALTARANGRDIEVTRRTLSESAEPVTVTAPDGAQTELQLTEAAPGRFTAAWTAPALGLYRLSDGERQAVVALGPAAPREYANAVAGPEALRPAVTEHAGGIRRIEAGLPDLRSVRPGRTAEGRGWLGITPRDAQVTTDLRVAPLLPGWGWLLLVGGLALSAWLRESRN
ncbi:hypothetical protein C2I36_11445 [Rhodobacteraceae bacterium WD3A24]|nr:hypothetical protein C2I36_11445 [Rhodobacteraceae bacterium WD3A24]